VTKLAGFDTGPSICVGKPLALLGELQASLSKDTAYDVSTIELRMATTNLVRDVDMKFAPGYKETWESDWQDYFVIQKGKLPVIATPRVQALNVEPGQ